MDLSRIFIDESVVSSRISYSPTSKLTEQEVALVIEAIRNVDVDIRVIHSVAVDYLKSMKSSSDQVTKSMVKWIMQNKSFEKEMLLATKESIIYSTLAAKLNPFVFRSVLINVSKMQWDQLKKMRTNLFMIGIELVVEESKKNMLLLPAIHVNSDSFLSRCG